MGGRQYSRYVKVRPEASQKAIDGLHIAERRVYVGPSMAKVRVRHEERPANIQERGYLTELLILHLSEIFEDTLGNDDIEPLITDGNGRVQEVCLGEVSSRIRNGDVDAMVVNVGGKQAHQGRRPAPDIQQGARIRSSDVLDEPG